ncbi:MAG: FAD:protein FMN transferase [Pirellulaceae bacterium]
MNLLACYRLFCVLLLLGHGPLSAQSLQPFSATQKHMGTDVTIRVWAPGREVAERGFKAAYARVKALEKIMSDYDAESEISLLVQQAPMGRPVPISADLWQVLQRGEKISVASNGAFDVSVGALSRLWRRARRQKQLPSTERLQQAIRSVGYQAVVLGEDTATIQLKRSGVRLDLGGIGKGFAADAALAELKRLGLQMALVDAGGDVAIGVKPPGKPGWRIGVAPLQADGPPSRYLHLAECGIATSGDAWQFVEIGGRRYSHILDPRTGLGLSTRSSVTVIAADATAADGLASAVSVLGPQQGLSLIERFQGAAALVVQSNGQRVQTWKSCRFPGK